MHITLPKSRGTWDFLNFMNCLGLLPPVFVVTVENSPCNREASVWQRGWRKQVFAYYTAHQVDEKDEQMDHLRNENNISGDYRKKEMDTEIF